MKEQAAAAVANGGGTEQLLMAVAFPFSQALLEDPNVWIADTAATSNSTPHAVGMCDLREPSPSDNITMGNGASVGAQKVGHVPGTICDKYGNQVQENAKIQDVTLIPGGKFNLFSLSKLQMAGWLMHGDSTHIWLEKGGVTITFDIVIPTPKGTVFAMYFKRDNTTELANPSMTGSEEVQGPIMNIKQAHVKYAHTNEDNVQLLAKHLGTTLTRGTLGPCEGCTLAKAKQKNVPKDHGTHIVVTDPNAKRVFLDIASIKPNANGWKSPKPNWRMIVDEQSSLKISHFYPTKNGMVEPTCELFHRWKEHNKAVKYLRMDNAGENKTLQLRANSKDWKLDLDCEFTARDTPQQNHMVELGLSDVSNKAVRS
jgi:hypothetical protein